MFFIVLAEITNNSIDSLNYRWDAADTRGSMDWKRGKKKCELELLVEMVVFSEAIIKSMCWIGQDGTWEEREDVWKDG